MQINPLVTVIITSYNHREFITQTIESVLGQTYQPIQLLIIDDCSTDGSQDLIKELSVKHSFDYLLNEQNIGLNNSMVKALSSAKGTYLCFVASDDYFAATKVEAQVQFLVQSGDDGVYSNGYAFENGVNSLIELNRVFTSYNQTEALHFLYQQDWGGPLMQSGMFKKTLLVDLVDIRREFKSDDWAFAIKAFEVYKIGFLNEPLFYYRIHNSNSHKKYWVTFPMRVDVASRLVPEAFRLKTLANLFFSQGQYMVLDKKTGGIRFFLCSLILNFTFRNLVTIFRTVAASAWQRFR